MATIATINIGAIANDDTGTSLRDGGGIINSNFTAVNGELVAATAQAAANLASINGLGTLSALSTVGAAQITAGAVGTAALANVGVTTAKIALLAVDTAQLANDGVTQAKMGL
ncbi:hypothetical protein N9980_01985, partial [bacterium]|nr:hypothetical protein [bacterium]